MNFSGFHPFTIKNGWQNSVILWCMLQAGPPSLHYYCAIVLNSCIVLPIVGHSSNHQYHCCKLTRQSSCVSNFYRILKFSFDFPSYINCTFDKLERVDTEKRDIRMATTVSRLPPTRLLLVWLCQEARAEKIPCPENLCKRISEAYTSIDPY